ncbi:MAG TPA: hypothetical protein PLH07_01760 [Sulfurovum sp.]|jgi:TolA-binding protein|nr:MAG: hypothetical protein B7Y63_06030 [Sulfurovum sp. 35-42-20]OYY56007.1 MAG: hypothetical protein B7Y52_04345 [Sulfurovum sp. 28-43-6]OYZ26056.1 MAG: hypothetical protein B7Y23_03390 [Sulfurovum sp. 16-42-52]OYZ50447.1 MAG: hypothetical protein B7Y13_01080 [Sulfurovum sp. 24-42-9]OZA46009.1 MAG: hypothetical protein B7X80_03495 [Sulfurovum sp. 17-42-90]HQS72679.1 hypothetical protein [Sulfurovum sp.]
MRAKYVIRAAWIALLGSGLLCAEPSVYGFGTDESSDTESYSDSDQGSSSTIASLRQQIAQQNERIDGLTTIVEGLSASINELQLAKNDTAAGSSSADTDVLLKKLAGMIDEINQNYVSKQELQRSLGKTQSAPVREKPITMSSAESSEEGLDSQSSATLYNEGVRFFVKKQYAEAQKRFSLADSKGYKPAASNYYLGEVAYYTNKYEDAIFYFKKSAGLYDKATYIDTLLLHTAISLEKTGDKGQAKIFYENIIQNYAGKKTADIAKQKLSKLK